MFNDQEKVDKEILDAIALIKDIINSFDIVKNNHTKQSP